MIGKALEQARFAVSLAAALVLVWLTGAALLLWDEFAARGQR
jgi:hypothetical protein